MKEFKTLQELKDELKDTDKETIIEMFYNTAFKLVKIEDKLDEINSLVRRKYKICYLFKE